MNTITIPDFSLVMMVGPSGSGKTTIARRNFAPSEIVSSDQCRFMVADDPTDQKASKEAFALAHHIINTRLRNRRLTVIDATNLHADDRRPIMEIAREHDCPVTAIAMNIPFDDCMTQMQGRNDQAPREHVVRRHYRILRQNLRQLRREHLRRIHIIESQESASQVMVNRVKARTDLRDKKGPFDIIGDVHGCHDELAALLEILGYAPDQQSGAWCHPEERTAIFLGDLVDRGTASDRVLQTVMDMTEAGSALTVMGNHENKLMRALRGNQVTPSHGLAETLEQLEDRDAEFRKRVIDFMKTLPVQYLLDEGRLAVAHAGVIEEYQNRNSGRIRSFCLYGKTTGESDEWGLPVRLEWAHDYRGEALVVHGHTPVPEPKWLNNSVNIDTGCAFGGKLTALRYPEREMVSVPALKTYYEPARTTETPAEPVTDTQRPHHVIEISDVVNHHDIYTRTHGKVTITEQKATSALETISRFAMDPRWLVYLPPTMSPCQTSELPDVLEHPAQAFEQYRQDGIEKVICQEKHMGSRAIMILGKDQEAISRRFGIQSPNGGTTYSRNGNHFFVRGDMEAQVMTIARQAATDAGLWEQLDTDWLVMDCEVMPWSLKAHNLLRFTYAPTGAAAIKTLGHTSRLLAQAQARGIDTTSVAEQTDRRLKAALRYREAYSQYCWDAADVANVKIAPFHIMAAESGVLTDRPHTWHMEAAQSLAKTAPQLFQATDHRIVDLSDEGQQEEAIQWWENLTSAGGEGIVVKPIQFVPQGKHASIQPAVKVRGPKYLSIIYGVEYDLPENISRLRRRNLRGKQAMAVREFALGIEGLRRFVEREPLYRIHQCAFGVLALESEQTDPRL